MSVSANLESLSFSSLDEAGQQAVRKLFAWNDMQGMPPNWDMLQLFRQRHTLAQTLAIQTKRLDLINPAGFNFLLPHQKTALEQDLLFLFYLLSAQYHLDESEHRRQNLKELGERIKKCGVLIQDLRKSSAKKSPQQLQEQLTNDSEKHLKYLGLTVVAPFIAEKIHAFSSGKTVVIKEWMSDINVRRLYWIWGGGLLASVIGLLPDDFANKQQAQDVVAMPSPVTGYMSFMLYYTRFGINLGLLLKHTIKGPWMSAQESTIPAWERFTTQWQQRKFNLLNDSIWATANLVCYFWLIGKGMAGYWGNVLTAGLLLMDCSLSVWNMCEEQTANNKSMLRYQRDIDLLNTKISLIQGETEEKRVLTEQLNVLKKHKQQSELEWRYKQYELINSLVYAVGLLAAFSVVSCFFFPPVAILPATAIVLGVVGAVLCFTVTIAYPAIAGALEISKTKAEAGIEKHACATLLQEFKQTDINDPRKKQLYLDIKLHQARTIKQAELIQFKKMALLKSVLVDALIPALIFGSFVFMPLGIGFAVFGVGLALAVAANAMLNRYKPDEAVLLPAFDESDYQTFVKNPILPAQLGFFEHGSISPSSLAENDIDDESIPLINPSSE